MKSVAAQATATVTETRAMIETLETSIRVIAERIAISRQCLDDSRTAIDRVPDRLHRWAAPKD